MWIDITFEYMNIIVIREANKMKGVPQTRSVIEETVWAGETVTFNRFEIQTYTDRKPPAYGCKMNLLDKQKRKGV